MHGKIQKLNTPLVLMEKVYHDADNVQSINQPCTCGFQKSKKNESFDIEMDVDANEPNVCVCSANGSRLPVAPCSYVVKAIIRKKLVFSDRPQPIVSAAQLRP